MCAYKSWNFGNTGLQENLYCTPFRNNQDHRLEYIADLRSPGQQHIDVSRSSLSCSQPNQLTVSKCMVATVTHNAGVFCPAITHGLRHHIKSDKHESLDVDGVRSSPRLASLSFVRCKIDVNHTCLLWAQCSIFEGQKLHLYRKRGMPGSQRVNHRNESLSDSAKTKQNTQRLELQQLGQHNTAQFFLALEQDDLDDDTITADDVTGEVRAVNGVTVVDI